MVSGLLVAVVLVFVIALRHYNDKVADLRGMLKEAQSSKLSLAATYGRITEQWAPFLADYPHDPKDFRFIGSPIDGLQFAEDKIVFVEIKTNTSRLSSKQRRIRELVEAGRVEWLEVNLSEKPSALDATRTGADVP